MIFRRLAIFRCLAILYSKHDCCPPPLPLSLTRLVADRTVDDARPTRRPLAGGTPAVHMPYPVGEMASWLPKTAGKSGVPARVSSARLEALRWARTRRGLTKK
jgi:hypothetical protein